MKAFIPRRDQRGATRFNGKKRLHPERTPKPVIRCMINLPVEIADELLDMFPSESPSKSLAKFVKFALPVVRDMRE